MFIKIYITITNQWLYLTHRSQCTGLCCVRGIPRICLRVIVMEDLVPLNILYANSDYPQHHIGLSLNVLAYKTEIKGVA
jgi:hypothetical protein